MTMKGESRKVWKAWNWVELIWAGFLEALGLEQPGSRDAVG